MVTSKLQYQNQEYEILYQKYYSYMIKSRFCDTQDIWFHTFHENTLFIKCIPNAMQISKKDTEFSLSSLFHTVPITLSPIQLSLSP